MSEAQQNIKSVQVEIDITGEGREPIAPALAKDVFSAVVRDLDGELAQGEVRVRNIGGSAMLFVTGAQPGRALVSYSVRS